MLLFTFVRRILFVSLKRNMIPSTAIGDLLLTKMWYQTVNAKKELVISLSSLRDRNVCPEYEAFIRKLVAVLFAEQHVPVRYTEQRLRQMLPYLSPVRLRLPLYHLFNCESLLSEPYVVLQTKYRSDINQEMNPAGLGKRASFRSTHLADVSTMFASVTCKYKIVIIGERQMHKNAETALLDTGSFYTDILQLSKHNQVLDYTVETLGNTPNYELFQRDIRLMHNAVSVIAFGIGAPMVFAAAFSRACDVLIGHVTVSICARIVEILRRDLSPTQSFYSSTVDFVETFRKKFAVRTDPESKGNDTVPEL